MPIVGALPFNIVNGQLEDATPVMANFNFLASQVNANAQPSGVLAEWVPSGLTPTFVSNTQFTVPGNVTSLFTAKRRVLLTVGGINGGATITSSSFGISTAVNVVTDTAGFLTAGVTAVAYGLLTSTILSTPKKSVIGFQGLGGVNIASNTQYTIGVAGGPWQSSGTVTDDFSEYNAATGDITLLTKAVYLVTALVHFQRAGATITTPGHLALFVGGVAVAGTGPTDAFTLSSASATPTIDGMSYSGLLPANAGAVLTIRLDKSPTFAGGPMSSYEYNVGIIQLF
jgi:hypothetical protein